MNKRLPRLGPSIVALVLAGAAAIWFAALRPGPTRAAALMGPAVTCGAVGTYGYTGIGYTYEDNFLGLPVGNASTNGTIAIARDGGLTIKEWEVVNGQLVPGTQPFTFEGQATINPDCTFTATLNGGEEPALVGVIVDNGNQVRAMSLIPGVQVYYLSTEKVRTTAVNNTQ